MSHVTLRMRLSLFINRNFVANCGDIIQRKVMFLFCFVFHCVTVVIEELKNSRLT
jgi:hypothetical protein